MLFFEKKSCYAQKVMIECLQIIPSSANSNSLGCATSDDVTGNHRVLHKTKALRPSPKGFVQTESILGRMGILGGIPVLLPAI